MFAPTVLFPTVSATHFVIVLLVLSTLSTVPFFGISAHASAQSSTPSDMPLVMHPGTRVRIVTPDLATVLDVAVVDSGLLVFNEPLEPNQPLRLLISYAPNDYLTALPAMVGIQGDDILVAFDEVNFVSLRAWLRERGISLVTSSAGDVVLADPSQQAVPTQSGVTIRYLDGQTPAEGVPLPTIRGTLPTTPPTIPKDPTHTTE